MSSEEDRGETQDDVEMQDETQPIRLMAGDCSEFFEKCLDRSSSSTQRAIPPEVIQFLKEFKDRFDAWASFLGVFVGENACLDYRLRRHPALQDMVIRLLDVLRRNLFLVGVYEMPETPQELAGALVDESGDHIMRDAPLSDLDKAFFVIEESITRLNKLGIAIRSSSRSTITARARRFTSQNPKLTRLREFEDRAYLALQSLYPNVPESLRQQLVAAMTDRHAKLQYESYRMGNTITHPEPSDVAASPSSHDQKMKEGGPVSHPLVESSSKQDATAHPQENQRIPIAIPASSIDTSLLYANLEKAAPNAPETKSTKTLTVHTTRPREPPVPKFEDGKDYTSCEWCFQVIDRSFIRARQDGYIEWSNEGRRHYRRDLQPYVCIAEGCCESRPTYSSSRDWFNHMVSTHSEYWSHDLHSRLLWTCMAKHDNDSLYMLPAQHEIFNHILLQHKRSGVSTQDRDTENVSILVSQFGAEGQRPPSCCPLCLFSLEADSTSCVKPDNTSQTTEGSHGNKRRLESLKGHTKHSSNSAEADRTITSWAMGSHIADHLHYLMIVSLQLMSAMNGSSHSEGDTQSVPNSRNSSISVPSDDQLEARLDDLPGELQGPISWSDVNETATDVNPDLVIIPDDVNYAEDEHGLDSSWDQIKPELAEARGARQAVETVEQVRYPNDYTVGWICAISTEYVAAQAFLDEEHEGPKYVSPSDNNDYTLGRIGKHNVVIAVLRDGEYGTSSAGNVASDMMHSFPNVRIGLMVGIGGGAPSRKHDIRLGDIVVSAPRGGKSGVLQYDFGKTIQNQTFQRTGVLNQPPVVLRAAVNGLKAQYESKGHRHEENINEILQKKPRLQKKYSRPNPSSDRLYQSGLVHPIDDDSSCTAVCGTDLSKLILRPERTQDEDSPTIHYGVIASGNQLMMDALIRDLLAAEEDILCFEMEAAGLMNHFPCLVIRGICDYSDSHKNKEWQGYAAMVAAAYAKDLLCRIAPNRVEAENKIGDILSGLQEVAEEHRDTAKEQFQAQKDLAKERLSKEEQECHQLFRLTTGSRGATYEWYKDRVEERVEDTCMWFLKHEHFQTWLNQESGPLLVSADPGCGKSVLAKYLIDCGLPRSTTICYFFFKDQDQDTVQQALCALLHQLFSQKPSLIKHAIPQFHKDGPGLINSTQSLWKVLRNAVTDPQAGPIILVLDALDECAESEFADLMRNIESQFHSDHLGHARLKYLLTCRPYQQIMSRFHGLLDAFPNIRIPGEEESETISQEVNHVITRRINQLSMQKRFSPQIKRHLEKRLRETTHRTYLWVYLVFDYLQKEDFKKTVKGIESTIATLPKSINEAYEQILSKTKEGPMVRKALSIILAARRPLTVSEMNIAMNTDYTSQSIHDLDLEDDEVFKTRLRSWCGLFVSTYQGRVYVLHPTAREFLLADLASPTTISSELHWHHSISTQDAHAVLAELCVLYLNFFNSNVSLPTDANGEAGHSVDRRAFLDYSARAWGAHFREAGIIDEAAIIPFVLRICNPDSTSYSVWFRIYWETTNMPTFKHFTDLMLASHYGHHVVVKLLLEKGADIESKDESGCTPLLWAAERGNEATVTLLLKKGADVESKDRRGRTPLSWAARYGHEDTIKLLLETGADVESKDKEGQTPLLWAAKYGYEDTIKLLIEKGADVESKDHKGRTPLSWAARYGHEDTIKLLLENGADVESKDKEGRTPL